MSEEYCKWCGSNRHSSDNCRIRNLSGMLTGDDFDPNNLPDVLVIANEDNLFEAIDEAHFHQHLREGKLSSNKHRKRTP